MCNGLTRGQRGDTSAIDGGGPRLSRQVRIAPTKKATSAPEQVREPIDIGAALVATATPATHLLGTAHRG
jgi:hypothetical protein